MRIRVLWYYPVRSQTQQTKGSKPGDSAEGGASVSVRSEAVEVSGRWWVLVSG